MSRFRPPSTPLCAFLATAIGVLGSIPLSLISAPAAHAVDNRLMIMNVVPGNGAVELEFADDSDHLYTAYEGACTSSDGGAAASGTVAYGDGALSVAGLTNFKTYTCVIQGEAGGSPLNGPTDPTAPFTPGHVPSKPTVNSVVINGLGSVAIALTSDPEDDAPIIDYSGGCISDDEGAALQVIHHSISATFTVSGLTIGATYKCVGVANNDFGSSENSDFSDPILMGTAPSPLHGASVTGTLIVQRTLTSHSAGWTGTPTPTLTRRWQRCNTSLSRCTNIAGATGTSYTLTNADVDMRIKFIEHATNGLGSGSRSAVTGVVLTVPVSTTGPYYYVSGGRAVKAPAGTVGATTHGNTAWRATANGNVFGPHFGPGDGTLTHVRLKKPIVGIVATASGKGYWMFAADGGIFTFGDAKFYGSTGALELKAPIISMTVMPNGKGYWLFASDGGVFTFGGARFYGSTGAQKLTYPVVAMLTTQTGKGYWLVTKDGRAIRFGDAANIGRVTGHTDIVGLVSTGSGYRFITARAQLVVPR